MADEPTKQTERMLRESLLRRSSQLERDEEYQASQRRYLRMRQLSLLSNLVVVAATIIAVAFYFREYMLDRFSV